MTQTDGGNVRVGGYYDERLDDVSTRLARMEGRMDAVATKEDVANAKLSMVMMWVGFAVAIVISLVNIGVILLRLLA